MLHVTVYRQGMKKKRANLIKGLNEILYKRNSNSSKIRALNQRFSHQQALYRLSKIQAQKHKQSELQNLRQKKQRMRQKQSREISLSLARIKNSIKRKTNSFKIQDSRNIILKRNRDIGFERRLSRINNSIEVSRKKQQQITMRSNSRTFSQQKISKTPLIKRTQSVSQQERQFQTRVHQNELLMREQQKQILRLHGLISKLKKKRKKVLIG